jgi:hypothetical protein
VGAGPRTHHLGMIHIWVGCEIAYSVSILVPRSDDCPEVRMVSAEETFASKRTDVSERPMTALSAKVHPMIREMYLPLSHSHNIFHISNSRVSRCQSMS